MKSSHTFLLVATLLLFAVPSTYCQAASWNAGTARLDITPAEPMWMSGYASRNKPAEGKLHELWAKALVLEDASGKRAVVLSLDLVGISRATAMKVTSGLKEKYGIERAEIAIATSHTHCGPVMGETLETMYFLDEEQGQRVVDYTNALVPQLVDLVGSAIAKLHPVTLEYGVGKATFAVNRRENPEKEVPALREAGKLKGPTDHALPVLFVKDETGKVESLLFGYACHATTLSFYQWCGDWPGFAQIELEKQFPGATAIFVAGCGADQNPLPRREVELAENYGRQIAAGVDAMDPQELTSLTGSIKTKYVEIDLPFSQLPTREQLEVDVKSSNRYTANRAKNLLQTLDEKGSLEKTYPYPIQVWSIGPLNMVFLGGEVVVDYSLRLKADSGNPQLWVAGYCNDVMAYIPSRRVLLEGGYEGATSMVYYGLPTTWAPQVETLIVDQVQQFLNE